MRATSRLYRGEIGNVYRFGAFALAMVVGVTSLCVRLFYLQIYQTQQAYLGGVTQTTNLEAIPSPRGLIYDASGAVLAKNVVDWVVTVTPNELPLAQERTVAERLGSILNMDPVYIETLIDSAAGSRTLPVKIADSISPIVGRFIEENSDALPGVKILVTSRRQYPTRDLFSEIVGYEGRITFEQYTDWAGLGYGDSDIVGQAGLEAYYEGVLRGAYGDQTVALDDQGNPIPGLITPGRNPVPGDSLTLNIDSHEQELAQRALAWGLAAAKVTKGVIIVENPQNGKILAMVSLPSFNNQLFADGVSQSDFQALLTSPDQPLVNKAVGGQYPPGSTFKLVTGTAGLADGTITTSTLLESKPFIQIGEYRYNEWDNHGWGPINITQAVAYSSDTFFYQLAALIGLDDLTFWADQYGFGRPTNIDLPETATGIVPTNAWKIANTGVRMYEGELMQAGIGQGFDAATPLQLLNAYCAMANGGNLWEPQIVDSITEGTTGTVTDVQPKLLHKLPVSQAALRTMREATRAVVTTRHTLNLVDVPLAIAGKTGTAEFGVPDRSKRLPYHEWFVGYTPADPNVDDFSKPDSQLAVVAFIYGGNTWGNVATEVVKYYMMLRYGLIRYPRQLIDPRTPGYVPAWVYKTTNFYGSLYRD